MTIKPERITCYSLDRSSMGFEICSVIASAINAADAGEAIKKHVTCDMGRLIIDNNIFDLNKYQRIFVIGAGKACVPMVHAVCDLLNGQITSGLVITKEGHLDLDKNRMISRVKIIEASHPIPDQRNLDAASKTISLTSELNSDDLIVTLLSGGGSSLLMKPSPGIALHDIQATTAILLKSGASIAEINSIRKHVDVFKGGGLLKLLNPAKIISLVLSDVVGDELEVIASGPTVADPTTFGDAWAILDKYKILDQIPARIKTHLSAGIQGQIQETVKPGDPLLNLVSNFIIGSNFSAVSSAGDTAKSFGFNTRVLTYSLQGEASQTGKNITEQARKLLSHPNSLSRPACLIAGGETTVTMKGNGTGGRNQELALGAVKGLSGSEQFVLATLATDGGDGPTDAAGAVTTNETYSRGLSMGLDPQDYLQRNDSYHYFEVLGDLIKTGPTLTNVNDLVFIFSL